MHNKRLCRYLKHLSKHIDPSPLTILWERRYSLAGHRTQNIRVQDFAFHPEIYFIEQFMTGKLFGTNFSLKITCKEGTY